MLAFFDLGNPLIQIHSQQQNPKSPKADFHHFFFQIFEKKKKKKEKRKGKNDIGRHLLALLLLLLRFNQSKSKCLILEIKQWDGCYCQASFAASKAFYFTSNNWALFEWYKRLINNIITLITNNNNLQILGSNLLNLVWCRFLQLYPLYSYHYGLNFIIYFQQFILCIKLIPSNFSK